MILISVSLCRAMFSLTHDRFYFFFRIHYYHNIDRVAFSNRSHSFWCIFYAIYNSYTCGHRTDKAQNKKRENQSKTSRN